LIDFCAFIGCSSLTSVTLPNSLTSIREGAFYECAGLESIIIPRSVVFIGSEAFFKCTNLKEVVIMGSIDNIRGKIFSECISLTSVIIPESVNLIHYEVFLRCRNLVSFTSLAPTPPHLAQHVFYGVNLANCDLYVPAGSRKLYQEAEGWKDFKIITELQ
jgi:hypothetical protein